ncbi:hypothetical protein IKF84_01815 [Candidatus Saccharibacteria bacterium]|nr:hypothetical protein [Candidatus Saccharibacteria bacterium]
MKQRKGDTLVEVAFAIGIFSLVAITVVAVTSASTSAAQASLETTLTREDIDGQAEALRFIHDSYVNGAQSATMGTTNPYDQLWSTIKGFAYQATETIKTYRPSTCSELYSNGWVKTETTSGVPYSGARPFIINIRQLHDPDIANLDNIIKYNPNPGGNKTGGDAGPFVAAETYPRILYGSTVKVDADGDETINEDLYSQTRIGIDTIHRVEGLFIIAVEGQEVNVITSSGGIDTKPAYYDFYIRSCWMPVNSDRPSTISTLVRLYDPQIIHPPTTP